MWKRVRLTLGLGTSATSLTMAAHAHPCARGIPYILYIKSSGSNTTWVEPSRNGCLERYTTRPRPSTVRRLVADRRAGDVAAQAFQAATLVRLADGGGMQ